MSTHKDQEMFAAVARDYPRLREYLVRSLTKQHEVLEQSVDEVAVRRAQGHTACLRGLIRALDASVPR